MSHAIHVGRRRLYYRKTHDCTFFSVRHAALGVLLLASNLDFRPSLASVQRYGQKLHSRRHLGHDSICKVVPVIQLLWKDFLDIFCFIFVTMIIYLICVTLLLGPTCVDLTYSHHMNCIMYRLRSIHCLLKLAVVLDLLINLTFRLAGFLSVAL